MNTDPEFRASEQYSYIALNKPFQMLSQFSMEVGSHKETLAKLGLPKDVYPVGRLDFDSEGLLILTDDPALNSRLLDPVHGHSRTYWAQVENVPNTRQLDGLRKGVVIEKVKTKPAVARLLPADPDLPDRIPPIRSRRKIPTAWLELILTEGRNRQVRKMTASVGCPTLRLVRAAIGNLTLSSLELKQGQWIHLQPAELALLFQNPNIAAD
jgi:23S rRNA pseudouridine2457 synthase